MAVSKDMFKFQFNVHSNLIRITGAVHEDQYTLLIVPCLVLLRMRNGSDKSGRENQNTFCIK